eukprot:g4093.t1
MPNKPRSKEETYLAKLQLLTAKQQRQMIHVKKYKDVEWKMLDTIQKKKDHEKEAKRVAMENARKKRMQRARKAKIKAAKDGKTSLNNFRRNEAVKIARIRKDLNFELTMLETKRFGDEKNRGCNRSDQRKGVIAFEKQLKRLGLGASDEILSVNEKNVRREMDAFQHLEVLASELKSATSSMSSEASQHLCNLHLKKKKNDEVQLEKEQRLRRANFEQRRAREEAEKQRHEQSELRRVVGSMSRERKIAHDCWLSRLRSLARRNLEIETSAFLKQNRERSFQEIWNADAARCEAERKKKEEGERAKTLLEDAESQGLGGVSPLPEEALSSESAEDAAASDGRLDKRPGDAGISGKDNAAKEKSRVGGSRESKEE